MSTSIVPPKLIEIVYPDRLSTLVAYAMDHLDLLREQSTTADDLEEAIEYAEQIARFFQDDAA